MHPSESVSSSNPGKLPASSLLAALLVGTSAFISLPAGAAWDGAVAGRISTIQVTAINNYPFRISLEGSPALCTAGHGWAYLDGNAANYKVFVSTLLTAKARGVPVTIYTVHDSSGMNYCRIEHIATSD